MSLVPYKLTALARLDTSGLNIIPSASVSVFNRGTGTYSTLKTDSTGATPLSNPFTCDANGEKEFWANGGNYSISVAGGQSWDISLNGDSDITKIDTWSAISTTTPSSVGQLFNLAQHTSGGLGGGPLISVAGSVTDDNVTQKNALGGFYLKRINYTEITLDMAGVVNPTANNITAITAAATAAAANNVPLQGNPNQFYSVLTNFVPPDNCTIYDLKLKRLSPDASARVFFKNSGSGNVKLIRCAVDRNGTLDAADLQNPTNAAGIWMQNISNVTIEGCEVFGYGAGTGIRCISVTNLINRFNYVHDLGFYAAVDPGTEYLVAMSVEDSTNFKVEYNRINNIISKFGANPVRRFQTDGIDIGGQNGCSNFEVAYNTIDYVNEAIDVTGSGGNVNGRIHHNTISNANYASIKIANANRQIEVDHNWCLNSGWGGIGLIGNSQSGQPNPENFSVHHNYIIDTGANSDTTGVTKDAIQIQDGAFNAGYPANVDIHNNYIIDRQATKTMDHGIKLYGSYNSGRNIRLKDNDIRGSLSNPVKSTGTNSLGQWMFSSISPTGTVTHATSGSWLSFAPTLVIYDDNALYSAGTFTIKLPGVYDITAAISWVSNATGERGVRIKINGSVFAAAECPAVSGDSTANNVPYSRVMVAGDVITFEYRQGSGGSLNINNTGSFLLLSLRSF
jgi:hypothetical protein